MFFFACSDGFFPRNFSVVEDRQLDLKAFLEPLKRRIGRLVLPALSYFRPSGTCGRLVLPADLGQQLAELAQNAMPRRHDDVLLVLVRRWASLKHVEMFHHLTDAMKFVLRL